MMGFFVFIFVFFFSYLQMINPVQFTLIHGFNEHKCSPFKQSMDFIICRIFQRLITDGYVVSFLVKLYFSNYIFNKKKYTYTVGYSGNSIILFFLVKRTSFCLVMWQSHASLPVTERRTKDPVLDSNLSEEAY